MPEPARPPAGSVPRAYERFLAGKLLLRAHRQRFVPLVALLSVGGVALGVAALIIVLAVMSGFERDLQAKITAMSAHVWVQPFPSTPAGGPPLPGRLTGLPGVEAAGAYLPAQALLQSRDGATGAVLFGLDGPAANRVVLIASHLKMGRLPDFDAAEPEVVLGAELASSLQVLPGDPLVLVTARSIVQPVPMLVRARVAAIFEVGMYDYDAHTAYLPLGALRKLVGAGPAAGAMVRVADMFRAGETARAAQALLGPGYSCRDWLMLNRNLFFAIRTEKVVMFLILMTIVTVAAFNITSSLIMTVLEKTRAIGILGAIGVPPRRIARIFITQGTMIGAAGIAAGVALGCGLCAVISVYPLKLPGGGSVYYLSTLPVRMNLAFDLGVIPAVALALCVLAAAYPARVASRLDPSEAIRHE